MLAKVMTESHFLRLLHETASLRSHCLLVDTLIVLAVRQASFLLQCTVICMLYFKLS